MVPDHERLSATRRLILAVAIAAASLPVFSSIVPTEAASAPGQVTSGAPLTQQAQEGWTSFTHWRANSNGSRTVQIFTAPEFRRLGSAWTRLDRSVSRHADPQQPLSYEGAIRPIRFGSSASRLVELELDGGPVTFSAPTLSVTAPQADSGGVTYNGVATDTDLTYNLTPAALKEALVLRSSAAPTSFVFQISDPMHQLGIAHQLPSGGVTFDARIDGGVALGLAAPYAYEQNGAGPNQAVTPAPGSAHMSVTPVQDGFNVTTSLDPIWLRGRSYPIVLDPSVTFDEPTGTMFAGSLYYQAGSPCNGGGCGVNSSNDDLHAGTYTPDGTNNTIARSLYHFNLTSIPASSTISAATLSQYVSACFGGTTCSSHSYTLELHAMTSAWDDLTYTWNQYAAITSPSAFDSISQGSFTGSSPFWETWSGSGSVAAVQGWVNDPTTNNGFVSKVQSEGFNVGGPCWAYRGTFAANPQPFLQVTYTPPAHAVVFIHGINANCNDIQQGRGWRPMLSRITATHPGQTFIDCYYQDRGYAQTGVCQTPPPDTSTYPFFNLYPYDASPTTCDSQSELSYDATALDDYLTGTVYPAGATNTVLISNSMGSAITRGWFVLANWGQTAAFAKRSLGNVDTAIFIQGAQQGSFEAAASAGIVNAAASYKPVLEWFREQFLQSFHIDMTRPGPIDLAPASGWYQLANSTQWGTLPNLNYYNFITDIHLQLTAAYGSWTWPAGGPGSLGDTVMPVGNPNPNSLTHFGGAAFLPGGVNNINHHQFVVNESFTEPAGAVVGPILAGVGSNSVLSAIWANPAAHSQYGDNMDNGLVMVESCNGGPQETPAQKIIDILQNPSGAC